MDVLEEEESMVTISFNKIESDDYTETIFIGMPFSILFLSQCDIFFKFENKIKDRKQTVGVFRQMVADHLNIPVTEINLKRFSSYYKGIYKF